MANGKEVTAITQAAKHLPLTIESGDDAWRHAQRIASSGLVPDALKGKPNDVMIVLMHGRRLGLAPEQAVLDLNVINGKVVTSAALLVAKCLEHRDRCAYFIPILTTRDEAVFETQQVGAPVPTRMNYTMADAKDAGLLSKQNWKTNPRAMLIARCQSMLARTVFPDLVRGFYTPDEAESIEPAGTATLVQAPKTLSDLTARLTTHSKPVMVAENLPSAGTCSGGVIVHQEIQADEMAEITAAEKSSTEEP